MADFLVESQSQQKLVTKITLFTIQPRKKTSFNKPHFTHYYKKIYSRSTAKNIIHLANFHKFALYHFLWTQKLNSQST